jgi:hypothetical protein
MTSKTTTATALALLAALSLSGCGDGGGGGVSSTPAPVPTPTSTGTAAGANGDLLGPLASETFANKSTRATANFLTDGSITGTAAVSSATIAYNSANSTYTLTTPTGSISFGPSELDNANSNSGAVVYKRTSGSTTDTLTLTRPGTSGRITYRYVGAAFLQRTVNNGSSGNGAIDALVYGAATPASAVPTGLGTWAVDLIGAETGVNIVSPLSGNGTAVIDFASGTVAISGSFNKALLAGQTGIFVGNGKLTSGTAAFTGDFGLDDFGRFTGSMTGQLFGPSAQEIGAAWGATGPQGRVMVGTLTGRAASGATNPSFAAGSFVNSQAFQTKEVRLAFQTPQGTSDNDVSPNPVSNLSLSSDGLVIIYNAGSQNYTLVAPDRTRTFVNGSPEPFDATEVETNGDLEGRTYVRGGRWTLVKGGFAGSGVSQRIANYIYGMPTTQAQFTRSGTATYALTMHGNALDSGYLNLMNVAGSGLLKADFGAGSLTLSGTVDYGEDYRLASVRRPATATGSFSGTGTIASSSPAITGSLSLTGIGNYTGNFDGAFYGPGAEEVGASFSATDGADRMIGVFTAGRDASIVAAEQTLAGITAPRSFTAFSVRDVYVDRRGLDFDPASGNWTFAAADVANGIGTINHSFGTADIDSAKTDATRTWYARSDSSGDIAGYLSKPGSANPAIALTYTAFGDLNVHNVNQAPGFGARYFLAWGIDTPPSLRPKGGTATYSGIVRAAGSVASLGYSGEVGGTSGLTADFAKGTADLSLSLQTVEATPRAVGSYTLPGQIANDAIFGSSWVGNLFGPNVEEFGAVFNLVDDPAGGRTQVNGVAVGRKTP